MIKHKKRSGIQKRYLKYTIALLGLALFLSSLGVVLSVKRRLTQAVVDQYEFTTEKMGLALENLYRKSDEATAECILYEDVQKSLQSQGLEEVNHIALSKYFAYIGLEYVADYCYADNKGNVYSRSYSNVTYEDIEKSGFREYLGLEYAKTQWFWTKDTLFGTGRDALFIGRYVRSMDYAHEPGMLFFKMDEALFEEIADQGREKNLKAAVGILDERGQFCFFSSPDETFAEAVSHGTAPRDPSFSQRDFQEEEIHQEITEKIAGTEGAGLFLAGEPVKGGVLSAWREADSGLVVFSFVPARVLNQELIPVFFVLGGIYLLVIGAAVILSIYFSKRFTKPIQEIKEAMTEFDGTNFERTIELHTNTELDEIGRSYNEMVSNIKQLLQEIKDQERELRTAELNMLISQINPHFLYNTLDTIYMLARINREETTMRMIQALSRYLRLSLSKGSGIVTVEDELENVKSYMEIQQIRNVDLFSYEIDCQVDASRTRVLKLILQPLVENAVKYGFQDIFEGGQIRISVREEDQVLYLTVYNNGTPIEAEMEKKINEMNGMAVSRLKTCFPDKKHGYGVVNIITRLRLKYGDQAGLFFKAEEEGTSCTIRIPGGERAEDDEE